MRSGNYECYILVKDCNDLSRSVICLPDRDRPQITARSRDPCLVSRLGCLFRVVAAGDLVTAWVVTEVEWEFKKKLAESAA